jgi:hypothetical protein
MSVEKFEAPYALVFNLDQYTGNYERDFCGFVFGAIGECCVGDDMALLYEKDHPNGTPFYALSDRCEHEPDDNGCHRPVYIYHDRAVDVTPYDSLIIFLQTLPKDEEMELIVTRAQRFCEERPDWKDYMGDKSKYPLTLKGIRLISNKVERVVKTMKQVYAA